MKTYTGRRFDHGCDVLVDEDNRLQRILSLRLDLRNHSDAFEWGYCGSGPAQLALALAADATGSDGTALRVYQRLKNTLVAGLPRAGWTITADEVLAAIRGQQVQE